MPNNTCFGTFCVLGEISMAFSRPEVWGLGNPVSHDNNNYNEDSLAFNYFIKSGKHLLYVERLIFGNFCTCGTLIIIHSLRIIVQYWPCRKKLLVRDDKFIFLDLLFRQSIPRESPWCRDAIECYSIRLFPTNMFILRNSLPFFLVTFLREFVVWGHVARVGALAPHGGDLDVPRLKKKIKV